MTVSTGGIITVQEHIIHTQRDHASNSGEFSWLLSAITTATEIIGSYVRRAGLADVLGSEGTVNVQGESVQKLDRLVNDTLMQTLSYRGNVGIVASEEDNEPRALQEIGKGGKYIVMFDPLDGSSNIDVAVSIGTIFSVLHRPEGETDFRQSVLQSGYKQIAAGYVLYGSSTVLVYTTGDGVHMFTLEPQFGAYVLVREHLVMPEYCNQYSVNEGYFNDFSPGYQQYLTWAKSKAGGSCGSRYIGSLVADFHRVLLRGGVFLYPPTVKQPKGKLRLLYESNPLAFIAEQAGGAAVDGTDRVLEIKPTSLHQRTPLIIGSKRNVQQVMNFLH